MLLGISSEAVVDSPQKAGLEGAVSFLDKICPIVRWAMYVGAGVLFAFVCFMFSDVMLRYLFDKPIPASNDIGSMVLVLLCFFAVAYTQLEKGHISVDLLTGRLKPRVALALSTAVYLICTVMIAVMVWRGILNTSDCYNIGRAGSSGIPFWPSAAIIPFGCTLLFIVFLRDLLSKVVECVQQRFSIITWFLILGLPILFMAMLVLNIYQIWTPVSPATGGWIGLVLLFVLIFLGMPVAFSILIVSVLIMGYSLGPASGFNMVGRMLYFHISSYTFTVVPLYLNMAYYIIVGGLGTAAFYGAYKWFGHYRGGLAMATVGGSTALASVVGSPVAALISIGMVAYPEMDRYKYSGALSTGVICAGATLGPMIPPSVSFIIYGIITETSIGSLFIAGIVPGLLMAASFVFVILFWCRFHPEAGPRAERANWSERFKSLPSFGPILLLFLLVIGGIYGGIFTAMEGGGIGAFFAFVITLASKKLPWSNFKKVLTESMKLIGMLLFVICSALIFSNSLGSSGLSAKLVEAILGLGLNPMVFVIIFLIVYLVFGIVSDAAIIILLTVPILAPVLVAMDVNLIWFGVLTTLAGGIGTISPPYAMSIFMLRNIAAPNLAIGTMFRGILPFVFSSVAVLILILLLPSLATWLPELMV